MEVPAGPLADLVLECLRLVEETFSGISFLEFAAKAVLASQGSFFLFSFVKHRHIGNDRPLSWYMASEISIPSFYRHRTAFVYRRQCVKNLPSVRRHHEYSL